MSSPGRSLLIAPLFLRLTLGATLLWTGMAQISATFTPDAAEAASLKAMKAIRESSPASDAPVTPAPAIDRPDTARPDPTGPEPAGSPPARMGFNAPPPESGEVPRLYRIALQSIKVAAPADSSSGPTRSLWPQIATDGEWPKFLAWTIAVGSVVAGSMLIAGLFVRLCGLVAAMFVGTSAWLFLVAPAIQSGAANYGFLPAGGMWELDQAGQLLHTNFMWMLLQLGAGLSLLFSGAGYLSLDRALFASGAGGPPARKAQAKRPAREKE